MPLVENRTLLLSTTEAKKDELIMALFDHLDVLWQRVETLERVGRDSCFFRQS